MNNLNDPLTSESLPSLTDPNIARVSARTETNNLAGMIANSVRSGQKTVVLQSIGAGALNQAIKGIALARQFLKLDGFDLWIQPEFVDIGIGEEQRTAIRNHITARPLERMPF